MDIFLVRHGEAAAHWGQDPDPGLSKLGEQQALVAAQALLPQLPDEVRLISSPLLRAQQTAMPLAKLLGAKVTINEAFREIPAPVPLAERKTWLRGFMQQGWQEQPRELLDWRDHTVEQLLELRTPTVVFTHFLVLNAVVGLIQEHAETLCFWPDNASITHLTFKNKTSLELLSLGAQMDTVVN